jgi:hypothetical protein
MLWVWKSQSSGKALRLICLWTMVISLNLVLAGLRLGLKNRQVGEKWISDDSTVVIFSIITVNNIIALAFETTTTHVYL